MRIDRLTLPISRMVLQHREDGKNLIAAEDALDILYEAEQQGVSIWREPDDIPVTAFGEAFPGDASHPTWWAVVGTAPADTTVHVTVDDEQEPEATIHRLAELWACEWIAHPAAIHVHYSDGREVSPIRIQRPNYLPPAPYPEWEIDS